MLLYSVWELNDDDDDDDDDNDVACPMDVAVSTSALHACQFCTCTVPYGAVPDYYEKSMIIVS